MTTGNSRKRKLGVGFPKCKGAGFCQIRIPVLATLLPTQRHEENNEGKASSKDVAKIMLLS